MISMSASASLLGLVLLSGGFLSKVSGQAGTGPDLPPPYDGCNVTDYYAPLFAVKPNVTSWTRRDVADLMIANHRRILDNVAPVEGEDDIFLALTELYRGATRETVNLVYREVDFPALPAGSPNTWKREDLWPISRGALRSSPALTDVHSKIPADATVLITKSDLFFGDCGTVQPQESCRSPATVESADGSEYDGKIFAAPPDSRGDIARSLFYTQLRYSETLGLILTDCPPFRPTEFGYLSTLLEWHKADPVSPIEEDRNDDKCWRWQGNRNPFVDFPELVAQFFGEPDTIAPGTNTFSNCLSIATNSPTATPNACSTIRAGDIPFFLMNSDNPDQVVFYTLADIDEDIEYLYVTDNAWNGERFVETEGVMRFSIPEGGIAAGRAFGLGDNSPFADAWEEVAAPFSLSTDGDNLFVYCLDADDVPNFLWGFSYNGPWLEDGLADDAYGEGFSALPRWLDFLGSTALTHLDNCVYNGTLSGRKTELQQLFMDSEEWVCQDSPRFILRTTPPSSDSYAQYGISMLLTTVALIVTGTLAVSMS